MSNATAQQQTQQQQPTAPKTSARKHLHLVQPGESAPAQQPLPPPLVHVLEGAQGTIVQTLMATAIRAVVIAPVLYLVGVKDLKKVAIGAAASSATITAVNIGLHAAFPKRS